MPDAMPTSMPGLHHVAQVSDSRHRFAKKEIDSYSLNTTSPESPIESSLRLAALTQHADGSFGSQKYQIQHTSLFIIGMLLSGTNWQGYKGALKKAALFLVKQPNQDAFYQACALTLIQKQTILIDTSLENHIEQCIQKLSVKEKKSFEEFKIDHLITFIQYLEPNDISRLSHEEMIHTLLKKIIP
jgi:hypothetical protein